MEDIKLDSIKKKILKSYEEIIDDLLAICQSPIEKLFFINLIYYFLKQTKSPIDMAFFKPIYDINEEKLSIECYGIEIYGTEVYKFLNNNLDKCEKLQLFMSVYPQYKINIQGNNYYLDFGIFVRDVYETMPPLKIAIECDGHEYHSTKESIKRDNIRMRNITSKGWSFIRFSGSEINNFNNKEFDIEMEKIISIINNYFGLNPDSNNSIFSLPI
ncbi:MAG: hypothetical protein ACK4K9_04415 [Bacteroidia bacterium]